MRAPRGERGWSAKVSLFMREAFLPSLTLLPFVSSSRRQNRIRYRVVQFSVYNSGSLHQLLNLLLRKKGKEKEREGKKEEEETDSQKSIFLPTTSLSLPLPPFRPHHHVTCSTVASLLCCSSLSSLVRLSLSLSRPHSSSHIRPAFVHSSMPH